MNGGSWAEDKSGKSAGFGYDFLLGEMGRRKRMVEGVV